MTEGERPPQPPQRRAVRSTRRLRLRSESRHAQSQPRNPAGNAAPSTGIEQQNDSPAPHPKDVRNKWGLAALAATAALLGAVVGVGGSVIVANKQITANRDLSSTQFRQEQRLKVYADVVTTMRDFQDDLIAVRYLVADAVAGTYDESAVAGVNREIVDHYNSMRPKVAAVQLLGGRDVIQSAEDLEQGFFDCLRNSYSLGFALKDNPVNPSRVRSISGAFSQCDPKMQSLVDDYLKKSRSDLGLLE
jgi:hypothetical protein